MPPIVVSPVISWLLGALGAAVLARWVAKEWRRVNAELDQVRGDAAGEAEGREELPTLKRDSATGDYRPG